MQCRAPSHAYSLNNETKDSTYEHCTIAMPRITRYCLTFCHLLCPLSGLRTVLEDLPSIPEMGLELELVFFKDHAMQIAPSQKIQEFLLFIRFNRISCSALEKLFVCVLFPCSVMNLSEHMGTQVNSRDPK